jgi:RNA polymerase sigma-70 factor (ECF subfamily)
MSMPFESAVRGTKEIVSESAESQSATEQIESRPEQARFFDEHAPRAKRFAMSLLRRWADAEEVTQEAFFKLIKNGVIEKVDTESAARAILFTTVRNLSIDVLRQRGRRKFEPYDDHIVVTKKSDLAETGLERLEAGVASAMQQLPEEWAEALQLKVSGGLSYEEIGNILNATSGQVRMWIFRGRKRLHTELKKAGLLEDEQ